MSQCYRIKNWRDLFETPESRKRSTALPWVAIPTKHDGKGYRRLVREFGPAVYGAWVMICAVAAKCPERGTLADADGPLSADDIADKTDCPVAVIEQALAAVSSDRIGWMESVNLTGSRHEAVESERNLTGSRHEAVVDDGEPVLPDITGHDQTLQNPEPVAGVSMKQDSGKKDDQAPKWKSSFRNLEERHLPDNKELLSWFEYATSPEKRLLIKSEANLLKVFGAAEHALRMKDANSRVGVFAAIVKKGDGHGGWSVISQAEEDRARARIKKLRDVS